MKSGLTNDGPVMIISEEMGTIRMIFKNRDCFTSSDEKKLNLRSRLNPGLYFYKIHCGRFADYGLSADDVFDLICDVYNKTRDEDKRLDEVFYSAERI